MGNNQPSFRSSVWCNSYPSLVMVESIRHGGVSTFPFTSMNLGLNTRDLRGNVQENRRLFCSRIGIYAQQLADGYQVHEDKIRVADVPGYLEGYDALVTDQPGIFLAIGIADCAPVLIYDPVSGSVGAAHAGWRGTVLEIAGKTVRKMQELYGTDPAHCLAFIGTCIDAEHFEVGEEVAEHFDMSCKRYDRHRDKYLVDLKKANKDQLLACGLKDEHIEVSPYSTVKDNDDYFSYRKEGGNTGRMLAVVGIRP